MPVILWAATIGALALMCLAVQDGSLFYATVFGALSVLFTVVAIIDVIEMD